MDLETTPRPADTLAEVIEAQMKRDVVRTALLNELRQMNRVLPPQIQTLLATEELFAGLMLTALKKHRGVE